MVGNVPSYAGRQVEASVFLNALFKSSIAFKKKIIIIIIIIIIVGLRAQCECALGLVRGRD